MFQLKKVKIINKKNDFLLMNPVAKDATHLGVEYVP